MPTLLPVPIDVLRWTDHKRVLDWARDFVAPLGFRAADVPEDFAKQEQRPAGHPPHYDGKRLDGSPNHMPWCRCSLSILLSRPSSFTGGRLGVRGTSGRWIWIPPEDHHLHAVVLGPDDLHQVEPHRGRRVVLLVFLAGEWK